MEGFQTEKNKGSGQKKKKTEEVKDKDNDNLFAERVLHDALDNIFQYLNLRDLCRAATVCKSWHYAVKREISKRNNIESLILSTTFCYYDDSTDTNTDEDADYETFYDSQNKRHFSDSLRSLPEFLLLFCDRAAHESVFYDFYTNLNDAISFGCFDTLGLAFNTTELCDLDNEISVAAITIPSTAKLKVNRYVVWEPVILDHLENSTVIELTDKIVDSLLSTTNENNCFIVLKNQLDSVDKEQSNSFMTDFSNSLIQRCKSGSYSMWGGGLSDISYSGPNRNVVWMVFIKISGLALRSWTVALQLNLSETKQEATLINLKKHIDFKSNLIALAMVPTTRDESFQEKIQKTEIFRKIFPNIPLVSVCEKTRFGQIGINSVESDPHPVIEHKNSVVYLILATK